MTAGRRAPRVSMEATPAATTGDRLPSGTARFDEILGGGLPANAINMIIGLPGTGKTILAQQYVFANATPSRPALYLTTASEPLDKLIRYGQGLSFFDAGMIGTSVFYLDLGPTLQRSGLDAALEAIVAALRDRRPGFIVIDSFKALETYAADALEFRRFVIELAGRLSTLAANAFWVGEYHLEEIPQRPEFAVADSIIALASNRVGDRTMRAVQVLKLRGSDFRSGEHAYRLSRGGISVYPRLADQAVGSAYALADRRQTTGVPALDEMLGGGLWPGSTILVAGPSGSGKTLSALEFLRAGAPIGEPGVLASLQENPTQIARVCGGYGWTLDDRIELMFRSPVDVYIDEWVYGLLEAVERTGARRIAIDSLTDLRVTAPDAVRFHEYIYSLVQRCSRLGVTLLMTHEIHDVFGLSSVMESLISHLADNVVLLRYDVAHGRVERTAMVLKTRASRHDPRLRRFEITNEGIVFDGEASRSSPPADRRRARSSPPADPGPARSHPRRTTNRRRP